MERIQGQADIVDAIFDLLFLYIWIWITEVDICICILITEVGMNYPVPNLLYAIGVSPLSIS